jgi:hypothetical protein
MARLEQRFNVAKFQGAVQGVPVETEIVLRELALSLGLLSCYTWSLTAVGPTCPR